MKNIPDVVKDINGNEIYIEKKLGEGGQGLVCRSRDHNLAIKFQTYNGEIDTNEKHYSVFQNKVEDVSIMRIDDDIHLCKPEVMLEKPICGYVMKLLNNLTPINDLIYNQNDNETVEQFYYRTGGIKKRIEVLMELSRTLARIHSKGMVYCDISPNNVYFAPGDVFSKVWLIDCDNLKFSSETKKTIFTPFYGAPEVECGISDNNIFSDCYSFAILAFKVLVPSNPFNFNYQGSDSTSSDDWDNTVNETESHELKINEWIGENLNDETREFLKHFLTKGLFDLFDKTLSREGSLVPFNRPSMSMWYEELKATINYITRCDCGQYIYMFENTCPFCNKNQNIKPLLKCWNKNSQKVTKTALENVKNKYLEDDIDDDFEETYLKKLNKIDNKLCFESYLYNNFNLYNFDLDEFTINENPNLLINFKVNERDICITNKSDRNLFVLNENNKLQLINLYHLERGTTKFFLINSLEGITKLISICYK